MIANLNFDIIEWWSFSFEFDGGGATSLSFFFSEEHGEISQLDKLHSHVPRGVGEEEEQLHGGGVEDDVVVVVVLVPLHVNPLQISLFLGYVLTNNDAAL